MHFSYVRDPDARELPAAGMAAGLNATLRERNRVIVTAPPGAGKSTLLPLTLLEGLDESASRQKGRILMLEPRRLAARQVALRMAALSGTRPGELVGYRMRFETCVSPQTRIEVLTEGILTRMLVADPTLEGVEAVLFDEFHERSLTADVALALTREAQRLIRPDLKIVLMSATLDAAGLCEALDAPLLACEGRQFPVEIRHSPVPDIESRCAEAVAHAVRLAHRDHEGDILAFLPGEAEIRKCAELLGDALSPTRICPLYGMLPPQEQQAAIAPSAPGARKVVLATPIAETSLTIEGVRVVIDAGLCRRMAFNPQTGLSGLQTVRISRDMAEQRSGRAGRVAPGVCYRLWSLATEQQMAPTRKPEILEADLAQVVLDLAAWGTNDIGALPWLTPPPAAAAAAAKRLLCLLGALTESRTQSECTITAEGRAMQAFPCHPRIAHMLVRAATPESKALACDLAALLEEKGPFGGPDADADLWSRIDTLRTLRGGKRQGRAWSRICQIAGQYRRLVRVAEDNTIPDAFAIGILTAAAYPERIARLRPEGCGHYTLASGDRAALDLDDPLNAYGWLAVASLNSRPEGEGRIFLAAPLEEAALNALAKPWERVSWDNKRGVMVAQREMRIGQLTVSSRPLTEVDPATRMHILCEAARKDGPSMFDWSERVQGLARRVAAVAAWHPELELPDLSMEAVLDRMEEWLPLYGERADSSAELRRIDLCAVLWGMLSFDQQRAVDLLAPTHIAVPTGSRIALEYRQGAELPVLRVRLQECFGLTDTPRVDNGRRPVLMELLSPGYKPVQLTTDLASFWRDTYFEVRKELRRRYPKHAWPDDPLAADPVRGVRRK